MANTPALVGALGSVIGYLGSEVCEDTVFERLLWPQRFYNDFDFAIFLKMALLMPMGGPLHKAALQTFDTFRRKGLYRGRRKGHMLGSSFFSDQILKYRVSSSEDQELDDQEVRNGIWVEALRRVKKSDSGALRPTKNEDAESTVEPEQSVRRSQQHLKHLRLFAPNKSSKLDIAVVTEELLTWRTYAGILASELSAIAVALVVGIKEKNIWFAIYLCLPLLLKLASQAVAVRREHLLVSRPRNIRDNTTQIPKFESGSRSIICEVSDPDQGFLVIEGPEAIVLQFFKHYGHPTREKPSDRIRECFSMALVFAFVLCFPFGLLAMLWVKLEIQYLWLSYQMYTVVAMHVLRLLDGGGCGRTEEKIAKDLSKGREVHLRSQNCSEVAATLDLTPVESIKIGRSLVAEIVGKNNSRNTLRLPSQG
ncbi:hypothetical protein MMC22_001654 [Lobaria immixta]|nr:hypothetical protein [Lobaria immixta]